MGEAGAEVGEDGTGVGEEGMGGGELAADEGGTGEVMRGIGEDGWGEKGKAGDLRGSAWEHCVMRHWGGGERKLDCVGSNAAGGAKSLSEMEDS